MQLDEELLALEAELPDLGPGEGVDLAEVLEDQHAQVSHGQVQGNALVILWKGGRQFLYRYYEQR
jgi:hypothetical protein